MWSEYFHTSNIVLRSPCSGSCNHCHILNNGKTTGQSIQRVELYGIFTQEPGQSLLQRQQSGQKVKVSHFIAN